MTYRSLNHHACLPAWPGQVQEARAKVRARVKQRAADVKEVVLDLHESVSDAIEDAVDDVKGYLGIEAVEESLEAMKRRTRFIRRIVLKSFIGASRVTC